MYASNSSDFPEILLRKRATILSSLSADHCQAGNERVNEEDQGAAAHEQFVSMRINNLDYAQLRLIDEALDRIASGDYGTCLSCEEEMPKNRLAAIPWARYCVTCQERLGNDSFAADRSLRLTS